MLTKTLSSTLRKNTPGNVKL